MTKNETTKTAVAVAEKSGKKPEAKAAAKTSAKTSAKANEKSTDKSKAKPARAKADKASKPARPDKPAHDFDFVGKVESLRVRSGAGPEGFEFGLRGRHGKRRQFRFDTGDAFAMNAMAHLVLAAHANDSKLGIRTAAEVDGIFIVRDIESRPKLGKD